jgi:hypothetical protein
MSEPALAGDASIDRFCVGCGYNLRGLISDRCPECGLKLDEAAAAPIPWEGRRHLGAFRAFWRTVMQAMFRWTISALVGVGLFPVLIGLIWLMIDSLRR